MLLQALKCLHTYYCGLILCPATASSFSAHHFLPPSRPRASHVSASFSSHFGLCRGLIYPVHHPLISLVGEIQSVVHGRGAVGCRWWLSVRERDLDCFVGDSG
ncbi:hypothetical protein V8C42DRAFT_275119 [Trichoderma barbatum]